MVNPKDNKEFMQVLDSYLSANGLVLPRNAKFDYIIDGILVFVDDNVVLAIGDRPPTVIFEIHQTEHTDRYLRPQASIAV